ncbi:MAG: NHLP bacteriocin export ABC transporter permease/ATPase subunit [Terrimicrobiaceae bacterium]|nr:NHLP bacteriocin export ABC transporter permease/ATPase subunit [Terrimicrobiaceae bacterium]
MNELKAKVVVELGTGQEKIWRVSDGVVELFLVDASADGGSRRHHLATIGTGGMLFDFGLNAAEVRLLAVGQPGAAVVPVTEADANGLDAWMSGLATGLGVFFGREEKPERGSTSDEAVSGSSGLWRGGPAVEWVDGAPVDQVWLPCAAGDWASVGTGLVESLSAADFLQLSEWRGELRETHRVLLRSLKAGVDRLRELERERSRSRRDLQSEIHSAAWGRIASVLTPGDEAGGSDSGALRHRAARAAFQRVAVAAGIRPADPPELPATNDPLFVLSEFARASSVRWRRISLQGTWFREDNGPMVGFSRGGDPVALLPDGPRRYRVVRADGSTERVDHRAAEKLDDMAVCLYAALPDRVLKLSDILRFAFRGHGGDLSLILVMVVAVGLLGLAGPAATARIFDVIVPQAERGLMLQLGVALLVAALVKALFELSRGIALQRIEARADSRLQAAVWDRLLKLPAEFFRRFTAGDLANRAQGITETHQVFSGLGTTLLFALPTGFFNLFVMFYHSWKLALVGLGIALVGMLVAIALGARQILVLREQYEIQGRLAGTVFQLISGVAKFRISAAEHFAFAAWARPFADQQRLAMRAGTWGVATETFFSVFALVGSIVVFGIVAWQMGLLQETAAAVAAPAFTTGGFLAFNAAFGALVASMVSAGQAALGGLQILPLLDRTKPIFEAVPESSEGRVHPGTLQGAIEISELTFSYGPDTPSVFNGLSVQIAPGQMVALVGPSGCGKSTLLRLLLGFEVPSSGGIFYDGKDLQTLTLREVRRQIGVVMQDSRLVTGDIFRNIVGEANLTLDDAWRAAEMAGLADDIRAMPMQMHTVVSEGGAGFSGGQRQRLAIARAFVRRPKLMFFDEATSALDNRTQSIVTESLERSRTTRLIIAHRLSTIMRADRILVLQEGRIVEDGTYDALVAARGVFYEFAQRQLF